MPPKTSKANKVSRVNLKTKVNKKVTKTSNNTVNDEQERKNKAIKQLKLKNRNKLEQQRAQILRNRLTYESSPLYLEEQRQNQIQTENERLKALQQYYKEQEAKSSQM